MPEHSHILILALLRLCGRSRSGARLTAAATTTTRLFPTLLPRARGVFTSRCTFLPCLARLNGGSAAGAGTGTTSCGCGCSFSLLPLARTPCLFLCLGSLFQFRGRQVFACIGRGGSIALLLSVVFLLLRSCAICGFSFSGVFLLLLLLPLLQWSARVNGSRFVGLLWWLFVRHGV